jgi:hypothetical protein
VECLSCKPEEQEPGGPARQGPSGAEIQPACILGACQFVGLAGPQSGALVGFQSGTRGAEMWGPGVGRDQVGTMWGRDLLGPCSAQQAGIPVGQGSGGHTWIWIFVGPEGWGAQLSEAVAPCAYGGPAVLSTDCFVEKTSTR